MGPPPRGLCFCAPWAWGIGEQSTPTVWWLDMMEKLEGAEEGENVGAGLRFSLRFDPRKPGFDRTLLSFPFSALFSRLLGWSKNCERRPQGSMMITEEGGQSAAAVAAAVAAAAAVSIYLGTLYACDQQPRRPHRWRRLSASALARPNSAAIPRALPAPDDGLRILSSNDESLENVIHGTSIGAGDDEPFLVARVETKPTDMTGANAQGEAEHDQSEKGQEEVAQLKELWLSLLEREQRLELRLMELDGLREQEVTVRDLENRVSVAAVEARLLEFKISSLQEENQRLNGQVSELDAVRAKLARAKEKLRALKARVQGEQEEARREAAVLREKLMELEKNGEVRARALAEEVAALRSANAGLEEENLEFALRLQDAEQVASVNLVLEEDIVEEADCLRETNERLTRQIEQLHGDHCAHVEELVYLKWVNACLRHELRGHEHHPSSGQQAHEAGGLSSMDLSKSMSYRSSEKAKQLMLQYGNLGLEGFDPALFSLLHESPYGDGDGNDYDDEQTRARKDEPERSPGISVTVAAATAPTKRARPSKLKFLKNIKNLLASRRVDGHRHGSSRGDRESKKAPIDEHHEKAMRWLSSHDALDGDNSYESTLLSSCERTPLSSVTTVDSSHDRARGRGAAEATASRLEAETARSKSDVGASYGREASRYHALRPDHPARVGPDGFNAPEKRDLRRRSEAMYARTRDIHAE